MAAVDISPPPTTALNSRSVSGRIAIVASLLVRTLHARLRPILAHRIHVADTPRSAQLTGGGGISGRDFTWGEGAAGRHIASARHGFELYFGQYLHGQLLILT